MTTGNSTVLIVDDDEEIRDVLRMIFELDGFTVSEAVNGLDAITAVIQSHPEFLILDYQMPLQDGEKTAAMVRSVAPETTIVALSGVLSSKPHWADAYLSKDKLAGISPLIASLAARGIPRTA